MRMLRSQEYCGKGCSFSPHEGGDPIIMKCCFVYILASQKNGTLYVGLTDDIIQRIKQHKNKVYDGFTKKYNVNNLVYFEKHNSIEDAAKREKQLKKWNREWKINLIIEKNPEWLDLSVNLLEKVSGLEVYKVLFKK